MKLVRVCPLLLIIIVLLGGCEVSRQKGMYTTSPIDPLADFNPVDRPPTEPFSELRRHSYAEEGLDSDVTVWGSRMVFSSTRHSPSPDIYIKNVRATTVIQRTRNPAADIAPEFSNNGKYIVFASNRFGNWDIFIMSAEDSSAAIQLTKSQDNEIHPTWSPDDKKIAYCSQSKYTGRWEIKTIEIVTGLETSVCGGLFPRWNPREKKLVFQRARRRGSKMFSVWTVNIDGTEPTEIVSSPDWAAINPAWDPTGRYIVFATVAKGKTEFYRGDDIYMIKANGEGLVQLTNTPESDWKPFWALDGRIYYTSLKNGFQNIWSLKPVQYDVIDPKALLDLKAQ